MNDPSAQGVLAPVGVPGPHLTGQSSLECSAIVFDSELRCHWVGGYGPLCVELAQDLGVDKTIYDLFSSEIADALEQPYVQALAGYESSLEIRIGSRTYLHKVWPHIDGGNIVGGMGFFVDLTESSRATRELRASKESLSGERRRLMEGDKIGHSGSWEWDVVTDGIIWSDGLFAMHGLAPIDFEGGYREAAGHVHPDDRPAIDAAMEACRSSDETVQVRYRVTRASDGMMRWFDSRATGVYENGQLVRLVGAVADVTEKVLAEAEVVAANGFQQAVLSASPDFTFISELWTGAMIYSSRDKGVLGLSSEEAQVLGASFIDVLVHPEDRPQLRAANAEARGLEDGQVLHLRYRAHHADGKWHWLSHRIVPFRRDRSGSVVEVLGVLRDVTEAVEAETQAKQREAALMAAEERWRATFDSAPVGMMEIDLEDRIQTANQAMATLVGREIDDIVGTRVGDYVHPEDATASNNHRRAVASGAPTYESAELRIVTANGGSRWVRLQGSRVAGGLDAPSRLILHVSDVTDQYWQRQTLELARDQATETSRLKSQFLANMSHEIRTPMNGVIGMSELLLDTELDDGQREYAESVSSSAEALMTLINDILDFSKVEAGRLDVESIPFSIQTVVEECTELLAPKAHQAGLAMTCVIAPELPLSVMGDPSRLRQVMLNLLGNAVKFTSSGEVNVTVSDAGQGDSAQVAVEFAVRDTGIGMTAETLDDLFQPFQQADSSTTRQYGGTGLGLAISHQLVELMGGTLKATSLPAIGSTFTALIPFSPAPAASSQLTAVRTPPRPIQRTNSSSPLLVAEDNVVNQKVLIAHLHRLGYRADVVVNGSEALACLEHHNYAAVLMDCQMPVLDGYEATVELRRREGSGRHTPVIALTASAMSEDRSRCLAAGMDDYLTKPIRTDHLREMLQRWIEPSLAT